MDNGHEDTHAPIVLRPQKSKPERRKIANQRDHAIRKVDNDQINARITRRQVAAIDIFCDATNLKRSTVMRALALGLVEALNKSHDLISNVLTTFESGKVHADQKESVLKNMFFLSLEHVNRCLIDEQSKKTRLMNEFDDSQIDPGLDENEMAALLGFDLLSDEDQNRRP